MTNPRPLNRGTLIPKLHLEIVSVIFGGLLQVMQHFVSNSLSQAERYQESSSIVRSLFFERLVLLHQIHDCSTSIIRLFYE